MKKYPVLISIPHASIFVPEDAEKNILINNHDIKNHADLYTDEIFNVKNAYIVKADISRLLVDVNRAPDDIEMECQLQADGVVVRTTPDGKVIYKSPPSIQTIDDRLRNYHSNFHDQLEKTIIETNAKFIIDGHSMWSIGPSSLKDAGIKRADICLGNRDYASCSQFQTYFIKQFFESRGYNVAINIPYRGKYILGFHCHRKKMPGIQIELNRSLYLNEKTLMRKEKEIANFKELIEQLVEEISNNFSVN